MQVKNLSINQTNPESIINTQTRTEGNNKRLFRCGKFLLTGGVGEVSRTDKQFKDFVMKSLKRHTSGDWGEITQEDAESNLNALKHCFELKSVYTYNCKTKIWIITRASRFATVVLFLSEF